MSRYRFTNIVFINGGYEADADVIDGTTPPIPPSGGAKALPDGWSSDTNVGYSMLVEAMDANGLTPIGVQDHGQQIVDALNTYWAFGAYPVLLSETDSPIWFDFGSLDVTIDSGKGGWQFRPDGYFPYP